MEADDLTVNDTVVVRYDTDANTPRFAWNVGFAGNAAIRNVGTGEDDVPVLGTGGVFAPGVLAAGGTDGQVLTRTATGQAWEDVTGRGGGAGTDPGYFVIPEANVGGTADAVELTTGENLTALQDGMRFFYRSGFSDNTGAVTIAVDGLSAAQLGKHSDTSTQTAMDAGDLVASGFNEIIYSAAGDRFLWQPASVGSASTRNIGNVEHRIPVLGTGGVFDTARLAPGGTDDQVLTRTATGMAWENATGGGARFYAIPDANVGGTADAITLTTGESITALQNGMRFFFRSDANPNTGAVTIAVDGLTALGLAKFSDTGTLTELDAGDLTAFDYSTVTYVEAVGFTPFFAWSTTAQGSAATRNIGNTENRIPVLASNGSFHASRLAPGGLPNQVLQRTSTGAQWASLTGGGGLTAVATATDSVLTGDGTAGSPLDLNFIDAPTGGNPEATDLVLFQDISANPDVIRRVTWGGAVASIADQNTIVTANGRMRINDEGVGENELDASNTPAAGQILSYSGGANDFQWVANAGTGVTTFLGLNDTPSTFGTAGQVAAVNSAGDALEFIDAGAGQVGAVRYVIPDANVGGTGNSITLTTGESLSSLSHGDEFVFRVATLNTGAVTVNVDGTGIRDARVADGVGNRGLAISELATGVQIVLTYDGSPGADDFFVQRMNPSDSTWYPVGTGTGDIPRLVTEGGSSGRLPINAIASGGSTGQVLTRTANGRAWMDAGAGAGDITAVNTPANGGLAGGADTGDVDLSIDLQNLGLRTTVLGGDSVMVQRSTNDPERITISNFLSSGGAITSVNTPAGSALGGGGTSGDLTMRVNIQSAATGTLDHSHAMLFQDGNSNPHRQPIRILAEYFTGGGGTTLDSTDGRMRVADGGGR